ncbi:DoxX family protein [Arthrobacter sp. ERGS1:01]|uniref:DoxX family protein n=1 Tax=Arthrobacter sp. ERGS1:01 TaxID=1704044 RepID=UPI0006B41A2C|nr:DoxX family protein [Arthrobacter sp. ERGS1:01]ALE05878.1 DoxX family protein [Arthrobacter sp. ERGS1:01]
MNVALWIVQILLAVMFLATGAMKVSQPIDKLGTRMPWVNHFPVGVVRFVGIAEILGAVGVILPQLTNIAPVLTPIAASALALVMVLAALWHLRQKEFSTIAVNAVLFVLAVFVAWGRFAGLNG